MLVLPRETCVLLQRPGMKEADDGWGRRQDESALRGCGIHGLSVAANSCAPARLDKAAKKMMM